MTEPDNAVLRALQERRSIRNYTRDPVDRASVEAILDAGRWSPSGLNNQPWKFLVILPEDPRQEILAGYTKYDRIVREAGALIAVFLDKEHTYNEVKDLQGVGACIQNMLLAVHALGLGAVWLGQIINQEEQVMEALKLDPYALGFMALLAVGHPASTGASTRRPLADLLLEEF